MPLKLTTRVVKTAGKYNFFLKLFFFWEKPPQNAEKTAATCYMAVILVVKRIYRRFLNRHLVHLTAAECKKKKKTAVKCSFFFVVQFCHNPTFCLHTIQITHL